MRRVMLSMAQLTSFVAAITVSGAGLGSAHRQGRTAPPPIRLLETGEGFHGNEIDARSGERWLGLYASKRGSSLQLSTVIVKRAQDKFFLSEKPGAWTGKSVSVRGGGRPIFLVRGDDKLRPGAVLTARRKRVVFDVHSNLPIRLGDRHYHLRVAGRSMGSDPDAVPTNAKLILVCGKQSQVLDALVGTDEPEYNWALLWAGDLDGDGRLDLYLDFSDAEDVERHALFLSSRARQGALLKKVAEFETTGG